MNAKGEVYVLEVNPLPGLTPDYSDLVLISKAAGIDYRTLIGEILAGGLKRMRERRRSARAEEAAARNNGAQGQNGTVPPDSSKTVKVERAAKLTRRLAL